MPKPRVRSAKQGRAARFPAFSRSSLLGAADSPTALKTGHRRPGLTLVELLVVLVILAIMTTIAMQATDMLVDQSRYNATQQTLQHIQEAIISPANQRDADGTPLITGFVADMGRLPVPIYSGGVLQGDPLRELWDSTVILTTSAYGVQSTANLPTPGLPIQSLPLPASTKVLLNSSSVVINLQMPCGWRGPYLRFPSGSYGRLVDGWGNPFDSIFYQASPFTFNSPPLSGQSVNIVRSRGADGLIDSPPLASGSPPLNLDMYVPDQGLSPLVLPPTTTLKSFADTSLGSVTVSCMEFFTPSGSPSPALSSPVATSTSTPTNEAVQVVLLAPSNGVLTPFPPTVVNSVTVPTGSATAVSLVANPTPTPVTVSFFNVPIGPRAVQAFHYNTTSGVVSKTSPILYLMVTPGGSASRTLIMQ